ncbi:MAG: diversity-generating retroelement protein Avd [Bacilli bacterium]|nr:diversity-generating retroelement protein Avd [Bacilli bacterium]MDD3452792.1 diversity-generating retroelement protein Avd [Bacilli bacterium]
MNDKKSAEDLIIYKQYLILIYYTEMITEKFPKSQKLSLVTNIKNNTYDGMKKIILAYKYYEKTDKLKSLNELDINLKMLKVLIRISYKRKYINSKNYEAWSKKINNIGNLLGGWIVSCLKQ